MVKHPAVISSIVVSASLLVCSLILYSAIASLSDSVRAIPGSSPFPTHLGVQVEGMNNLNVRVENGGGGGESFRVMTDRKP